ncbi:lysine transporter LysE [Reticulibacter mediterranei]|uniref:Lysine transporter LysE n=1 Tax=Reticulibacter mediterranei TaxID=2778369 RepID=A0A8J3IHW6_9CHLR|nr:LysE family translocator [Reticulibacter mediterranei]GHO92735.1 lysine transporter LysE [Reticulibacter mediterranei]
MLTTQLFTFLGIITVLTITPGADTMLVIRNVVARGQRAGYLTALGICSGLFIHATLSALGLSVILVRSAAIFEIVKLAGACYLIILGAWSLWQMIRSRHHTEPAPTLAIQTPQAVGGWRSLREGLLTNVLNPKVAIFYLAFLPQFINPGDPILLKSLLLAGLHFVLSILWLALISTFLGRLRGFIARPAVQRGIEAVAGTVLIAFGIRLATTQR